MTAPFECEVRFRLADVEAFHRRLRGLGARLCESYAFTDHYYRPGGQRWDPRVRALRVREWDSRVQVGGVREQQMLPLGSEVLLTHVEMSSAGGLPYKRSLFAEGKLRLYAGTLAECRQVVGTLGFLPWIAVHKQDGRLFEIPDVGPLVTEHVAGLGWMCEVEEAGEDVAAAVSAIRTKLAALGVSLVQVTGDPVAALAADAAAAPPAQREVRARPKIYFGGAIRGGRDRQPLYRTIVDYLRDRGCDVLTTHVADPDVLQQEGREGVTAGDIYARDLRWLAGCDLVIAEVSTPSLGVGVEITEAQHLGKRVVVLCQAEAPLSAMVGGNPALTLITYRREEELLARLDEVLHDGH